MPLDTFVKFSVEHIGLAAMAPLALKEWYVAVLGAELVYADGKSPPAFLVRLPGAVMIEIYPSEVKVPLTSNNRLAGWRHLALAVDSIEAGRDLLAKHGVEFEPSIKPAGGGGRVLFFRDPEGNLWHLVERPKDSIIGSGLSPGTAPSA
jgi:catechol 2,3-dioxygenase-like lactoylglutathione lyase family enzyme